MRFDPRRNLAATAAGIWGVVLFALPWLLDVNAPLDVARLVLLAAGVTALFAGSWPSRRGRFVLLVPVVLALTFVSILASEGIGLAIMATDVIAAYALFIEYARERGA
ncbi:MAG TPA: hypothetical protein VJ850_01995 [Candidatus Limnocylindrales bacterium]|nr:hypothetical protein [Candidatus Limnocylindrales bacterium]